MATAWGGRHTDRHGGQNYYSMYRVLYSDGNNVEQLIGCEGRWMVQKTKTTYQVINTGNIKIYLQYLFIIISKT